MEWRTRQIQIKLCILQVSNSFASFRDSILSPATQQLFSSPILYSKPALFMFNVICFIHILMVLYSTHISISIIIIHPHPHSCIFYEIENISIKIASKLSKLCYFIIIYEFIFRYYVQYRIFGIPRCCCFTHPAPAKAA